jgi:hypothetical protein
LLHLPNLLLDQVQVVKRLLVCTSLIELLSVLARQLLEIRLSDCILHQERLQELALELKPLSAFVVRYEAQRVLALQQQAIPLLDCILRRVRQQDQELVVRQVTRC